MRRSLMITTVLASLAFSAQANNEGVELRSKSLMSAASISSTNVEAPFRAARDPLPELLLRDEQERRVNGLASTCDTAATSLCYDMADRRIVYKGARQYMPQFAGLQAESVSVRHNRIILKYSFK